MQDFEAHIFATLATEINHTDIEVIRHTSFAIEGLALCKFGNDHSPTFSLADDIFPVGCRPAR